MTSKKPHSLFFLLRLVRREGNELLLVLLPLAG
jgi:hypothetical protein